jgi:hypothetical protein
MPVRHQPGNIVVRNCKVENAARLVRYNYGGETWQHARELADITFEGITASGLWLPVALNGGRASEGDRPITFTMKDSTVGFAKSQEEIFSVANVKTLALTNVTFRGANAPLARTWDGRPALELSNVKGAGSEIVGGKEPYECPMR